MERLCSAILLSIQDTAYILQEGFDPDLRLTKWATRYAPRCFSISFAWELDGTIFLEGPVAASETGSRAGSISEPLFCTPYPFGRYYITSTKLASESKEWLRDHLPSRVWNALYWAKVHTFAANAFSE